MFFAPTPLIIGRPPDALEWTFIGATTSNGSTLTYHANKASGDVAVYIDYAHGSSNPSSVTPSGHTQLTLKSHDISGG